MLVHYIFSSLFPAGFSCGRCLHLVTKGLGQKFCTGPCSLFSRVGGFSLASKANHFPAVCLSQRPCWGCHKAVRPWGREKHCLCHREAASLEKLAGPVLGAVPACSSAVKAAEAELHAAGRASLLFFLICA